MQRSIAGISIPDSQLAREVIDLVKEVESPLLFDHSLRVFVFGALRGQHQSLKFDSELLFLGAMFHDVGLTPRYSSQNARFEVDGANAARNFMQSHGFAESDIEPVWDGIALHTTPGIPQYKKPVVALVTAGVEMDVLGLGFSEVPEERRHEVIAELPRVDFKEGIINAFAESIRHKPDTAFGNVKSDVLERQLPGFRRTNFCEMILGSGWSD